MAVCSLSRSALGGVILFFVVVIWVSSGLAIQMIFEAAGYDKPVALTTYSVGLSAVLLVAFRKKDVSTEELPLLSPRRLPKEISTSETCVLGSVWFLSQLSYNVSLKFTSVASNTCISSSSSVFTFLLSIPILGQAFRPWSFLAVLFTVAGVVVTAVNQAKSTSSPLSVHESVFGDSIALSSACCYAFFTTLLKRWVKHEDQVARTFGFLGVVAFAIGTPLLVLCHLTGLEEFEFPTGPQFAYLTANALVGSVLSDFLLSLAVVLLSPLTATVGLALTIPLSIALDSGLHLHSFQPAYLLGSVLVFIAVVISALDQSKAMNVEREKGEQGSAQKML